ncbi:MAG: LacI family DNA-binding transcriptional regulator [Crocinitomicaceae bacterium]|nr:LacI family DNA-binding transcriptional regulator [Crocinitomicaceae bacterium]
MKTKRTSLNDIAKALNVSKATVSFVLNDKGDQFNISKEKQKLIKAKAKELAYVPNFFAKSLRQGETKTIGLVLPDISNPFYAEICKTIQEKLYRTGYNTLIVNTNDDNELEKVLMRELIQRSIDGMIIAPSNNIKELVPILLETHIPVVFTDRMGDENTDFVGVDNLKESKKLIQSFTVKPKKVVALVPRPADVSTIQERISGTRTACENENIDCVFVDLPEDQEKVNQLIIEEIDNGADSFIALNNKCTFQALAALNNANIDIPKEVRLISFDDSEAFQYMNPPISALRQPIVELGLQSVKRMYERLKETKEPGEHFLLPCEFMARGSH